MHWWKVSNFLLSQHISFYGKKNFLQISHGRILSTFLYGDGDIYYNVNGALDKSRRLLWICDGWKTATARKIKHLVKLPMDQAWKMFALNMPLKHTTKKNLPKKNKIFRRQIHIFDLSRTILIWWSAHVSQTVSCWLTDIPSVTIATSSSTSSFFFLCWLDIANIILMNSQMMSVRVNVAPYDMI